MRLVDRVAKLAADAADLARILCDEQDIVRDVIAALESKGIKVTHGGHQLLREAGIRLSSADGLGPEDVLFRRVADGIEVEPEVESRWFGLQFRVPTGVDLLTNFEISIASEAGAFAFVRTRLISGEHVDGERVRLGNGSISQQLVLRAPRIEDKDRSASHLFLIMNGLVRLRMSRIGVVYLDH